jgi:hypothetical protein
MDRIRVDDVEISKADVVAIRARVIKWRDESFKHWPNAIDDTLATTYLIGFLAGILDQYPEDMTFAEFQTKYDRETPE